MARDIIKAIIMPNNSVEYFFDILIEIRDYILIYETSRINLVSKAKKDKTMRICPNFSLLGTRY